MASITLAQAGGAGTAAENASLETAWQGLPITATLSDEGAAAVYAHELLEDSPSDGLSVAVTNAAERVATFTPSGGSGSFLLRSTVTDAAGAQTVFVRVVRITKDAAGATLDGGLAKPAFGEEPGHSTFDARGAAGVWDRTIDALKFSAAGSVPWSPVLRLDRTFYTVAEADALGRVTIALDDTGHETGAVALVRIPANEVAAVEDLLYPTDIDPFGNADPFDPTSDYLIAITCVDGTGAGKFRASLSDVGTRTTTAPTFVTLEVGADLDKLTCEFDLPMLLPDLTGASLTGTSVTIASIFSVTDDRKTWVLDLSADIDPTATISLVLASTRTWRALNGTKIAAGTYAVATQYDFAATTGLRAYFDPPVDCDVTTDGGAVTALTTTGAGGVSYTGTGTYRATGLGGKPCVEANGTSNVFNSAQTLDAVAAAGAFYLALVVEVTAFGSDSGTPYANESPWTTGNGGGVDVGIYLRSTGPAALAYVFSGGLVTSPDTSGTTIASTTPVLLTMRLEGGNLYLGVNGVEAAGDACGNMDLTPTLRLLRGTGGGLYFEGKMGRWLACDVVPGATERAALEAALKTFYGIA